jgi:hypothetical protein
MGVQERRRQKRIRDHVIERDGLQCCYCAKELNLDTVTMEHIVPDSKKGTFNTTNLTVSCAPCNNRRGNKPFFEFCKEFNFSDAKLAKYRAMYLSNLRIKILNIAKEECLNSIEAVPLELINQSCKILRIKDLDFSKYENMYQFDIKFDEPCNRKRIKYNFELLIRIIESEA